MVSHRTRPTLLGGIPGDRDRSQLSIKIARAEAKVQQKVKQIVQGSIEDLSIFKDESLDTVICLGGPLCHILDKTQRNKAIDELTRVTKKGSPIFTSFIGRLSILTVGLTLPTEMEVDDLYLDVYKTGDYDGNYGFTDCHFYLPEEAVNQLEGKGLRILEVAGLEGFASSHWRETNRVFRKCPKAWKNWWKIHLETCVNPTSVGMSEHFLIVSRKEMSPFWSQRVARAEDIY